MAVVIRIHPANTTPLAPPVATIQLGWQTPFDTLSPTRTRCLLAEFSALPLLPTAGLPPGGHGDYPRFMPPVDGAPKKKKSVRPIWDRGPPAVDQPKTEPPAVEARAAEPAPSPGRADVSNLTRLLDPPAPIKVERPKRKVRSVLVETGDTSAAQAVITTLARGHLEDDADHGAATGVVEITGTGDLLDTDHAGGRGTVDVSGVGQLSDNDIGLIHGKTLIRIRAEAREDPDVLIAHATWDDDELALRVLGLAEHNE